MNNIFGKNVRRIRRNLDMTQSDLAKKAGLGKNTILRIETSQSSILLDNAIGIAKALGTTIDELLK